jgi:hypothetical protein
MLPRFRPVLFAALWAGLGCGSSASVDGAPLVDASIFDSSPDTSTADVAIDGGDASVFDSPDTSAADVALDAGDGSPPDALSSPCGPCPLADADGGARPETCGGDPCWVCRGFESNAYCVDGQWLRCGGGFGRGCRADAAPPEGTRCCFQDYKPDIIGFSCPNCVGGHRVFCGADGDRLVYLGPCTDLDASGSEASGDALSDDSSDAMDSASQ